MRPTPTLIDFVSDRRAPTPTAAAEIATPVLAELRATVMDYARRTLRCTHHGLETRAARLSAAARGLPRPVELLALASQRYDLASERLGAALERNAAVHERDLTRIAGRLNPALLARAGRAKTERLADLSARLDVAAARIPETSRRRARLPELDARLRSAVLRRLERSVDRLAAADKLRASFDPDRPLALGFARVSRADGHIVRTVGELSAGEALALRFVDGTTGVRVESGEDRPPLRPAPRRPAQPAVAQGDLF